MKTCIQMLHLDQTKLYFFFDQDHQPAININGAKYTSLYFLYQDFPSLATSLQVEKIAQITNFLVKGLEFQFIENIIQFKEEYTQVLEAGQIDLLHNVPCMHDYGIYDVSLMHKPKIVADELIFFVKHGYTQLPYKVSLNHPLIKKKFTVQYELLPFL
jgi:hypothetical protein